MTSPSLTRRQALLAGLGASAAGCAAPAEGAAARFEHGVASGDPGPDRVVIWTRATPRDAAARTVALRWVVAEDPDLAQVVAQGETTADAANDYCAKVDVTGLAPGRVHHYGFVAGDAASPVGRAKTLPAGALAQLKIAVFSCSNYPFGRFHAYRDMAERGDVDVAIHLGDYIYEYGGPGSWGWDESQSNGRAHEPQGETVTLEDYRTRYRQYRADPDLQAAHAATSWILTWDDHEIANNPWVGGAQNHNPRSGEGTWEDRKAAAVRAFFEWMPIREPEPGRAREAIWRAFDFGDLARLVMLETRLTGRDRQLDYGRDLADVETAYYVGDPENPVPILDESQLVPHDPPNVERLRTPFDVTGSEPRPVLDYALAKRINEEGAPAGVEFRRDVERFRRDKLEAFDRRMIAEDQEAWLLSAVEEAEAGGVAWQVLGNQTLFVNRDLFDFAAYYDDATIERLSENRYIASQIERGRYGLPSNLDEWGGYPVQRDRIADALSAAGAHAVIVSGDSHAFWASEIQDSAGARCAAEFGTAGVTSPGYADDYAGVDPPITEVFADGHPELRYTTADYRGYLMLTLTRETATCEMIDAGDITADAPSPRVVRAFVQRRRDASGALPALDERDT